MPSKEQKVQDEIKEIRVLFSEQLKKALPIFRQLSKDTKKNESIFINLSDECKTLVHKIAGTAKIFGFPTLSPLAEEVDILIDKARKEKGASKSQDSLQKALDALINEMENLI